MYTNRGFLHRTYGQKASPRPKYELRLPKVAHHLSPPSNFTPSLYSTNVSKSSLRIYDSLSPSYKKPSHNIFSYASDQKLREYPKVQSYPSLSTNEYSKPSKNLEKILLPKTNHVTYSVFEIFGAGYSYNTKTGYGSPLGMGFLITKSLALTANSVIPDEEVASRCFARFTDNVYEVHSFDSTSFFYTNRELNFTVIGFAVNPDSQKPRIPLEFREEFVLKDGDTIAYLNSGSNGRNVTGVDEELFTYTAGTYIIPGMPIFTYDWHLQGLHHTCTASYRFNQATRIDAVIKSILKVRSIATHPELDLLLTDYTSNYIKEETEIEEGRYLY